MNFNINLENMAEISTFKAVLLFTAPIMYIGIWKLADIINAITNYRQDKGKNND
ncbi:MAG: hypothetical protein KGV56_03185 [Gammaproteobacteria bacterium]|nr:hypothetical protein [Gammaproteobacteria bacterium]